jgi:hypothetical protein
MENGCPRMNIGEFGAKSGDRLDASTHKPSSRWACMGEPGRLTAIELFPRNPVEPDS